MFLLDFSARSLTLSARTRLEHDEWVRAFDLIMRMNRVGVSPIDRNPYVFEEME